MTELELCPFCGGTAKLKFGKPCQQKQKRRQAFVQCTKCGAKSQTVFQLAFQSWEDTKRYAIALWNRREPNWISVESDLPEPFEVVLVSVLGKNGFGEPDSYSTLGSYNRITKAWDLIAGSLYEGEKVTHWQRRPEPPKGDTA